MGIMDTLKGMLGGKGSDIADKLEGTIDAAADKADDVTGGKASGAIDSAAEKAKDVVGDAVEDDSGENPPE